MKQLEEYIEANKDEYFAYDVETDGVDKGSRIIGFSICGDLGQAFYVILYAWDIGICELKPFDTLQGAPGIISKLVGLKLVMQNAVFDCTMTKNNFGIDLMPSVHTDTMILGHLLNENRSNGLKERGIELFGEDAAEEQRLMKESVAKNGGVLTKQKYELYKADSGLLAKYGAKDALLTLKLFYHDVPLLFEQGLQKFFYEEESMPLLRGPTYELNTVGLKVDNKKLQELKAQLQIDIVEAEAYMKQEIAQYVKGKYPGTGKTNHFNINACQQLAWLLFEKLGNQFNLLTKGGRELCQSVGIRLPYSDAAKRDFIHFINENKGLEYKPGYFNKKAGKQVRPKVVGDVSKYLSCGKESLTKLANKYIWVATLLQYKKNLKLLNTYVMGIESRMSYGIIRPQFLQIGTTSGRYSSKNPNFTNLPRDDKRIKSCIIARGGRVFVGSDFSQLEPRVFASVSGDEHLLKSFARGEDFYSVIGSRVFNKPGCSLKKDDPNSFAKLYPELRQISKTIALSVTYGTTAPKLAPVLNMRMDEAQEIIDNYFKTFPKVRQMMLDSHKYATKTGEVQSIYGRPRRIPKAKLIPELFPGAAHDKLDYDYRNLLNLAVNHRIQSTAASITNRAMIAVYNRLRSMEAIDEAYADVHIVLMVHDSIILEGPEHLQEEMKAILQACMENAVKLPGVKLVAQPSVSYSIGDQK